MCHVINILFKHRGRIHSNVNSFLPNSFTSFYFSAKLFWILIMLLLLVPQFSFSYFRLCNSFVVFAYEALMNSVVVAPPCFWISFFYCWLCRFRVFFVCKALPSFVAITFLCSCLFIFLLRLQSFFAFFLSAKLLQAMFIKLLIVIQFSFPYFQLCNSSMFFAHMNSSKFCWCSFSLLLLLFLFFLVM